MAFEGDWVFLRTALPDLRGYILSSKTGNTLAQTALLPVGIQLPQISIGNLLLKEARLASLDLSRPEQVELESAALQVQRVRDEWASDWQNKAVLEFIATLMRWQRFLQVLRDPSQNSASLYPCEVTNRVILRLLAPEILKGVPMDQAELLGRLDTRLKNLTQPGPFLWEKEVQDSFPEEGFWFLYLKVNS